MVDGMSSRGRVLLLAALLGVTAVAYLPGIDGVFLFDDDNVLGDPLVREPFEHGMSAWISSPRPLTTLTFALNFAGVGADTRGWHVANVAIHLAVVVLAWLFARRTLARAGLSRPELSALAAAALFALHPLQSESVAYLSQRAESLASGLYLLAFLLLLARDEASSRGRRHALLAGAFLVQGLGTLTKPIVATLPVAWLLHAAILPAPAEEGSRWIDRVRRRLAASVPLLALAGASAAWNIVATTAVDSVHAGFHVPGLTAIQYLATQSRVIPTYLRLALWPTRLCADWTFPASAGPWEVPVIACSLLLLALVGGAVGMARRAAGRKGDGPAVARAAAFGSLFFFVALAPSSSFVPLIDPIAEHRVYLGLLGLAIAAASGGTWTMRRIGHPRATAALTAGVLVLLLALGWATARRAAVWTTRLAFWADAAQCSPDNSRAQMNLGSSLVGEERYEEALPAYRRARALAESDPTFDRDLLLRNVVGALTLMDRLDEARAEVLAELRRAPRSASTLGLLAQTEFEAGRAEESESAAARALALDGANAMSLKVLGKLKAERGELGPARDLLRAALAASPLDTSVSLDLGRVELRLGNRPGACVAFLRAATEQGPDWVISESRAAYRALGCR
jgi:Flp pilus assembly protein TadD